MIDSLHLEVKERNRNLRIGRRPRLRVDIYFRDLSWPWRRLAFHELRDSLKDHGTIESNLPDLNHDPCYF